jgi:hypothetical protein
LGQLVEKNSKKINWLLEFKHSAAQLAGALDQTQNTLKKTAQWLKTHAQTTKTAQLPTK